MKIDVGAIAKGWVAREICNWAKENLWNSAMLSLGGNICTFGFKNNDGSTPWNVQIESPDKNDKNGAAIVKVHDKSVVTSGDYQRYFEVDGKRYCHIINPDTLYPAEYVRSVSVICDDSALADALSTTLFNMPIEDGKALIEKTDGCATAQTADGFVNLRHRREDITQVRLHLTATQIRCQCLFKFPLIRQHRAAQPLQLRYPPFHIKGLPCVEKNALGKHYLLNLFLAILHNRKLFYDREFIRNTI